MTEGALPRSKRDYPDRPIVGVGAVIFDEQGRALLVKRANEPRKGRWHLPGGKQRLGEAYADTARREIAEETGLEIEVLGIAEVFDAIYHDDAGRISHHYLLIDVVARAVGGTAAPGDDAEALAWIAEEAFNEYHLDRKTREVIAKARTLLPPA